MKRKIPDHVIIEACEKYPTMSLAAASVDIHFQTFRKYAISLGVWRTNQGGKGTKKPIQVDGVNKFALEDILKGKHPQYPTGKLKLRLYAAGLKTEVCECCGQGPEWNGKRLVMQLDHIDGNSTNHRLENLQVLCPNCHTQTDTWCGKNR